MSSFMVDAAELDHVGAQLTLVSQELGEALLALDRDQRAVLGSGWSGPAAQTFAQAWQEWADGGREVIAGLRHLVTALSGSASAYAVTESAVHSAVHRADGGGT